MLLDICNDPNILQILSYVKKIITVIMIVVPTILLFSLIFKAVSATIKGDDNALATLKKKAVPNIVAAVLIFIVPFSVNIILNLNSDSKGFNACLSNATPEGVEKATEDKISLWFERTNETLNLNDYNKLTEYIDKISEEDKKEKYTREAEELYRKMEDSWRLKITNISIEDTVVIVTLKANKKKLAAYYFSSIEKEPEMDGYDWIEEHNLQFKAVKYPGTYYLYVKDTEGHITGGNKVEVPEAFNVVMLHKGYTQMPVPISTYLNHHGSSVDEFNKKMSSYNKKHEYRTRESVVTGAMAFIGEIQSWGYYLPYGGKNSGGNSTIAKNAWGVYPDWGGGDETFLACDPFVVWAFKQAGLNIYANRDKMRKFTDKIWTNKDGSTQPYFEYKAEGYSKPVNVNYFFVGVTGSKSKLGDNIQGVYTGKPGDVLQEGVHSGHEMLIVDRYDEDEDGKSDGYIVLQSQTGGACYEKIPYSESVVYDMTNVYDNTAGFADLLLGWNNYYIPESDYPSWMR